MFNLAKTYGHVQASRKRDIVAPLTDRHDFFRLDNNRKKTLLCSALVIF